MFKGTNVIERIAAASIILKKFADLDCFLCLATHDVELSRILGERYENYHFREVVTNDEIFFDYTLRKGVTTGSNAIKLLAYCQYDQEIVSQAEAYAESYRTNGSGCLFNYGTYLITLDTSFCALIIYFQRHDFIIFVSGRTKWLSIN